jgi:hypothetical protein
MNTDGEVPRDPPRHRVKGRRFLCLLGLLLMMYLRWTPTALT